MYYNPQGSETLQAISQFGNNLKKLEHDIKKLHKKIEPRSSPQGLDTIDYTETESVEIENSSRKSIIDELDNDMLKETSSTNYPSFNNIFCIKQQTQMDEISLQESVINSKQCPFSKYNQCFQVNITDSQTIIAPKSQRSSIRLKNMMINQLLNSQGAQKIISSNYSQIHPPNPLKYNFSHYNPKNDKTITGGTILKQNNRNNVSSFQ